VVAPAAAKSKPGGNSNAAHLCQHGGWKHWVREDQTPFKNSGACVSYAAHGGTLTEPKSAAQRLCESLGGVFAPGNSGNTLWYCTYTWSGATNNALAERCFADGGNAFEFLSGNPGGVRMDGCFNV
jgi:hypothetical protein